MPRRLRESNGLVLFRGQRKANRQHVCEHCDRVICRNEYYFTRVVLTPEREIHQRKSCCKEV